MEIFRDIFTSAPGSFGLVFALVGGIIYGAFKIGEVNTKYKLVDKVNTAVDKIKEDIAEIKAFIEVIKQGDNPFAKHKSPISLTEEGETASKELNAKKMISKKWNFIISQIEEELNGEDNPYDIQQACFKIGRNIKNFTIQSDYDKIKKYAFDEGVDILTLSIVFGIEIRDKYFSENNIKVDDIDKHDPSKV